MSTQTSQQGLVGGISRLLHVLDKGLSWFENWTLYMAVMIGMLSLFVNVVLRYGFNYSLAWSEEMIREIIIFTTFIGCSAAIKNRSQITIDAVVQLVPRLRRSFTFLSQISVLVFSVMLIYLGTLLVFQQIDTDQSTIILEIPLWIIFLILPVMGVSMGIRTIQVMWQDYLDGRSQKQAG